MAISVRGVNNAAGQNNGSTGTAASTVVVTAPGSLTNGDREFIAYVGTTSSVSLTANGTGWTLLGGAVSQISTGSVAAGGGSRWMAIWYRDKDASWSTQPTVGMASHAAPSMWAGAVAITPTSGSKFLTPTFAPTIGASGLSNVTNYSGGPGPVGSPAFVNTTGGLIIAVTGTNDNVTSTNASNAYAGVNGATYGTTTERCDGGTATGNDVSGKVHTAPVTSGANPAYGALTLTLSAATQAETAVIEQRELAGSSTPIENVRESFDTGGFVGSDWYGGLNSFSNGEAVMGSFGAMENGTSGDYTIVGSSVFVQVKAASSAFAGLWSSIDSNQIRLCWFFNSGGTTAQAYIGGTGVVGSSTTHTSGTFYRIRESAGTVYWDYASNPAGTWTNQYSTALSSLPVTFFPNNVHFRCDALSPGSLVIDNLNVAVYGTMGATLQKATFTAHEPFAKMETLTWDFTSSNAAWDTSSAPSFALSGGQGVFSLPGFTVLPSEVISTFGWYDITGSYAQCQLVQAPLFSPGLGFAYPVFVSDDTLQALWYVNGSGVATVVDTTGAEIATRTHTDGDYYRIRESGGLFYAEYGTSGSSWTTLITFSTGGMNLGQVYPMVGCYRIDTNPRTMKVDNFNVAGGATGTIAATLRGATAAITSAQAQSGAIAASALKALGALGGTHVENDYGTIAASALRPVAALSGAQAQSGSVAASALPATGALTGSQAQTGTIAATLQRAVSALTGDQPFTATVGATLQRAVSALSGTQAQSGSVAAALQMAVGALSGAQTYTGTVTSVLQMASSALSGLQAQSGAIAGTMQRALGSLTGVQTYTGAVAAALQRAVSTLAGAMNPSGEVAATLLQQLANLAGAQSQSGSVAATIPLSDFKGVQSDNFGPMELLLQKPVIALEGHRYPKIETIVDDFNSGSFAADTWFSTGDAVIVAGEAVLGGAGNGNMVAPVDYMADARGSSVYVKLSYYPGTIGSAAQLLIWTDAITRYIGFYMLDATTYFYSTQAGILASAPYDPVQHKWLKVEVDSTGDIITGSTSPDGLTWTTFFSSPGSAGVHDFSNVFVNFTGSGGSGTTWDNVNVPPPTVGVIGSSVQQPVSSLAGSHVENPTGTLSSVGQKAVAALAGTQLQTGVISSTAQRALSALAGVMPASGVVAATAQRAVAALSGSQTYLATVSATAQRAVTALVGYMEPSGVISGTLQKATAAAAAVQIVSGTISATLQRLTANLLGTQTGIGTLTAETQKSTTNIVATQTIPGMIVVGLKNAVFSGTDMFMGIAATARRALFSAILRIVTQTPRVAVVEPENRVAIVTVELREALVSEESRLIQLGAEPRGLNVEFESRSVLAGLEDREMEAVAENRSVIVATESREGQA